MTLAQRISVVIEGFDGVFSMEVIYNAFPDEKETTVRGRVYRELMGRGEVERVWLITPIGYNPVQIGISMSHIKIQHSNTTKKTSKKKPEY